MTLVAAVPVPDGAHHDTAASLAPGETRAFPVPLLKGQFVHAEVVQTDLPLTVRLVSPDGDTVVEVANPTRDDVPLPLSAVATASGTYRLTVTLEAGAPSSVQCQVNVWEPRPSVPLDEKRIASEAAFAEAMRVWADGSEPALRQAVAQFHRSAELAEEAGDTPRQAYAVHASGSIFWSMGDFQLARAEMDRALGLRRSLQDLKGIGDDLNNLGVVEVDQGEPQTALESYDEALSIARKLGNRPLEAHLLHNIGFVHDLLGEPGRALDFYRQALALKRLLGNRGGEATTLDTIGLVYIGMKDYGVALRYHRQALAIRRSLGDRRGQAITLTHIGWAYTDLGRAKAAVAQFEQALELDRAVGNRFEEAITLDSMGETLAALGERERGLECHREALRINQQMGNRNEQAIALSHLAHALRDLGRLEEAREAGEASLRLTESFRAGVTAPALRTSYAVRTRGRYDLMVDILARLQARRPDEALAAGALATSERARARSLLELMAEARVDLREGADPTLLARERSLADARDKKSSEQATLIASGDRTRAASAIDGEIQSLTTELEDVRGLIRSRSPRYAALAFPQPLDLSGIQSGVVDSDSILLEYYLGDEGSVLWAVGPDWIAMHQLPGRAVVEATARRLYQVWKTNSPDAREERRLATAMSKMLLGPVAARLGSKRLLVAADGALQYLPFAALPVPGDRSAEIRRLVEEHEVVNLPSASALAALRREAAERLPAPLMAAVFADPVFDARDSRVGGNSGNRHRPALPPGLERAAKDSGLERFDRLPATRGEAESILALVRSDQSLAALDFQASRSTAMGSELGRYHILHFATHGLLDSLHPELSGLVLSLVDEAGHPQNGFLRAQDIFGLKLNADLVVLSACQTALGKDVRGEGLLGLTRGFMYAGTPRVVASLWKVSDRATAELMRRFYRAMLVDGLAPAAALHVAQLSLERNRHFAHPYAWAAFVLQGEWR